MEQRYAYPIHNCLFSICGLGGVLAKTGLVNPINRYLMLGDKVADD